MKSSSNRRRGPPAEVAAFRIVQEALTNVAKHAQATACRIYLQRLSNSVSITIEDDGTGFDLTRSGRPAPVEALVYRAFVSAWRSFEERSVSSTPGKGTQLTVELPARIRSKIDTAEDVSALTEDAAPARGEEELHS